MQILISRHKLDEKHDPQRYSVQCHGLEIRTKGRFEPGCDATTIAAAAATGVGVVADACRRRRRRHDVVVVGYDL